MSAPTVPGSWPVRPHDDPLASIRNAFTVRFAPFAFVIVTPFSTLHFVQGEWLLGASILAPQVMLLLAWVRLKRGISASPLVFALAVCNNLNVVMSLHHQGAVALPWVSAALISNYFLLSRRRAHLVSLCMLVAAGIAIEVVEGPRFALRLAASSLLVLAMLNVVLSALARAQERLTDLAEVDPLTGAGNKRRFDRLMAHYVPPSQDNRPPNVLLAIDIDHFKAVNDGFGHCVGDEVLKGVAQRIGARLRDSDQLFRIGGEEFAVILTRTGMQQAVSVAEDIRRLFDQREVVAGVQITVSIGLCEHRVGTSIGAWMRAADDALYKAKRSGRNQVVVSQ